MDQTIAVVFSSMLGGVRRIIALGKKLTSRSQHRNFLLRHPGYKEQWYRENRTRMLASNREYRKRNRIELGRRLKEKRAADPTYAHKAREAMLKRNYDLSEKEYDALLESQGGKCAICMRPPIQKKLVVDHDHETGKIRGLLCDPCNRGIGFLGDSAESVSRAVKYLRRDAPE